MYKRLCPSCNCQIAHPNQHALYQAIKRNRPCVKCCRKPEHLQQKRFSWTCNSCSHISWYVREPEKPSCAACAMKKMHRRNPSRIVGQNNPMYGLGFKEIWRNTLTHEQFETKMKDLSVRHSKRVAGKNNPMFGKPPGLSAGRGISGKWNGLHFRSLLELAFIYKFLNENQRLPHSAENAMFRVALDDGSNYYPDFYDPESQTVFEIKPSKLISRNKHKIDAAISKYGNKFVVVTEKELPYKHIWRVYKALDGISLNRPDR